MCALASTARPCEIVYVRAARTTYSHIACALCINYNGTPKQQLYVLGCHCCHKQSHESAFEQKKKETFLPLFLARPLNICRFYSNFFFSLFLIISRWMAFASLQEIMACISTHTQIHSRTHTRCQSQRENTNPNAKIIVCAIPFHSNALFTASLTHTHTHGDELLWYVMSPEDSRIIYINFVVVAAHSLWI